MALDDIVSIVVVVAAAADAFAGAELGAGCSKFVSEVSAAASAERR